MGGTKGNWYRLNICVFPKFICWNLMVTEGGAFGRWLSRKGEALMDGVSALIKETLESSLSLLPCEDTMRRRLFGHSEKMAIYELASGPSSDIDSASSLILDLPRCLSFKPPVFCFSSPRHKTYTLIHKGWGTRLFRIIEYSSFLRVLRFFACL